MKKRETNLPSRGGRMGKRREDGFAVILVIHEVVHLGGGNGGGQGGRVGGGERWKEASIGSSCIRGPAVLWGTSVVVGGLQGA